MNRKYFLFFRYRVAPSLTLELRTNQKEIGKEIGEFLFWNRQRANPSKKIRLSLVWDQTRKQYKLATRSFRLCASKVADLFPAIDFHVRSESLSRLPTRFFPIHSAGLVKNHRSILLVGKSGIGKSTALSELIRFGFLGLSDELNFLDLKTLCVFPYERTWVTESENGKIVKEDFSRQVLVRRKIGKKTGKPIVHYYLSARQSKRNRASRPQKIGCLYHLKMRTARSKRIIFLGPAEIFNVIVNNEYAAFLRTSSKKPVEKKFEGLLRGLFKALPVLTDKLSGYEVRIHPKSMFSQVISGQSVSS